MPVQTLRLFLISISFSVIVSCATSNLSSLHDRSDIKGSSIQISLRKPVEFSRVTQKAALTTAVAGTILIGPGGGRVGLLHQARKVGKPYREKFELKDPGISISERISDELSDIFSFGSLGISTKLVHSTAPEKMADFYNDVDFIVDVKTEQWGTFYYSFTSKYDFTYIGQIRLIDIGKQQVVAKKNCRYAPLQTDDSPSLEVLYSNNGKLIKEGIKNAENFCVKEFLSSLYDEDKTSR